jgi:hypothetical protein
VSLITLGLALDYKTEGGLAATDPITISSRPFFWQQMERTRANFVTLNDLAPIKMAQVTLTDAQIKTLPTTPVTLITAPGGTGTIVPISVSLKVNASAGAYTNKNATYSAIAVYWLGDFTVWATTAVLNDSTTSPAKAALTNFLNAQKSLAVLIPYHDWPATTGNGWVLPSTPVSGQYENKALAIAADNNGSSNYTGGNAANTMLVTVLYMVL